MNNEDHRSENGLGAETVVFFTCFYSIICFVGWMFSLAGCNPDCLASIVGPILVFGTIASFVIGSFWKVFFAGWWKRRHWNKQSTKRGDGE